MTRRLLFSPGLFLAQIALAVWIGLGAYAPMPVLSTNTAIPICHTEDGGAGRTPATPMPHGQACLVCPLCVFAATPALTPLSFVPLAPRIIFVARAAIPPPPTAPPSARPRAALPRGPPSVLT